jgi:hypothetical protein
MFELTEQRIRGKSLLLPLSSLLLFSQTPIPSIAPRFHIFDQPPYVRHNNVVIRAGSNINLFFFSVETIFLRLGK